MVFWWKGDLYERAGWERGMVVTTVIRFRASLEVGCWMSESSAQELWHRDVASAREQCWTLINALFLIEKVGIARTWTVVCPNVSIEVKCWIFIRLLQKGLFWTWIRVKGLVPLQEISHPWTWTVVRPNMSVDAEETC